MTHAPPTPEEIAEWRRLSEAATPAPWRRTKRGHQQHEYTITTCDVDEDGREDGDVVCWADEEASFNIDADLDVICAARNALPRLIDEVQRLRIQVSRMAAERDPRADPKPGDVLAITENGFTYELRVTTVTATHRGRGKSVYFRGHPNFGTASGVEWSRMTRKAVVLRREHVLLAGEEY